MSGLREMELELEETKEMCREMAPVGLQEGAGGLSFTMVCVPKGMHGHPRDRDEHMAACSIEEMIAVLKTFVSVKRTKAKDESIWGES